MPTFVKQYHRALRSLKWMKYKQGGTRNLGMVLSDKGELHSWKTKEIMIAKFLDEKDYLQLSIKCDASNEMSEFKE